jgi:hypothetical protein
MRKLTVKNFSVIKDAELEFGKITVLIGPQSSGKNLLCKLAYFFSKEVLDSASGRIFNDFPFSDFESELTKQFTAWFPPSGWGREHWTLSYVSADFEVSASGHNEESTGLVSLNLEFGKNFEQEYIRQLLKLRPWAPGIIRSGISILMGRGIWESATYIPSERSYFVDIQKGYRLLANQSDPIANEFSMTYAGSLNPDRAKRRLNAQLGGELIRDVNSWLFRFNDGRLLPLNDLSTGSKEMLPLLSVLEMYFEMRRDISLSDVENPLPNEAVRIDEFFVEEPEAHIFPEKQYEIVQYFAELLNDQNLRARFSITTHSPYILSSFNNLIYAGQLASDKPELKEEIAKLVPVRFWIENGGFRAYCIHDGKLESILSESGLIDGEYLDSVSNTIGNEFDSLLRLEYDHTEVS